MQRQQSPHCVRIVVVVVIVALEETPLFLHAAAAAADGAAGAVVAGGLREDFRLRRLHGQGQEKGPTTQSKGN